MITHKDNTNSPPILNVPANFTLPFTILESYIAVAASDVGDDIANSSSNVLYIL